MGEDMLQGEFQDSDCSKDDEELIIKPPQTSSNFDPVLHHRDKKRKRHSKECKSSRKHHHHHHYHHHSHKNGHLKLPDPDSSKRNQNMKYRSFHCKDNEERSQTRESNKGWADLEIIDVRSKTLIKDVMQGDRHVEYRKVTNVRHTRFIKDIRENRRHSCKEEKKNIHYLQEMKTEWKKKRSMWVQNQDLQDDTPWTEKVDLLHKNAEKEIDKPSKNLHLEHPRSQNNSLDSLQVNDEQCYSLISSEESMHYEESDKDEALKDEENEHVSDQENNTAISDTSSGDNAASRSEEEEEENAEIESDCEDEKVFLRKASLPSELDNEIKLIGDFKKENKNSELVEENKKSPVSPKKCSSLERVNEQAPNVSVYCPAIQGCRSIDGFHVLNRIEEGTYGVVYRARDRQTKEIVALKRLKMEREKEGFPITSLREINTLLKAQHPNIVTVREIVVGSHMDRIYIVMDYVEHDLKSLMKTMPRQFLIGEVKTLLMQLLCAVAHLHDNWILHRDLKTSNLLLSHQGILKVGDFGLAREYGSPLKSYTPVVVTLWYRAPELLLGAKKYSTSIDMWSVGCIFAELLTKTALFPGKSESDQINKIFKDLGTPSEKIWPGYSELPLVKSLTITHYPYNNLKSRFSRYLTDIGFDLLNKFLTYNPARRISAEKAKSHEFFNEKPKPVPSNMFPTWPARSEQGHRETARSSPKAPIGGLHYSHR